MNIIALLPMKAHSERIPNKNFKELSGKPLFKWMLDKLLSINEISQVIINTDAIKILTDYGIDKESRVVLEQRPDALCGDMVNMNRIIEHDINNYQANQTTLKKLFGPPSCDVCRQ